MFLIGIGEENTIEFGNQSTQVVWVKKYSDKPSRDITISCSDSPKLIWNILMKPKCNSTGTYVDIEASVKFPIELSLSNGQTLSYEPDIFSTRRSSVTSTSESATFTLSVK
jgi:hypothetical protein